MSRHIRETIETHAEKLGFEQIEVIVHGHIPGEKQNEIDTRYWKHPDEPEILLWVPGNPKGITDTVKITVRQYKSGYSYEMKMFRIGDFLNVKRLWTAVRETGTHPPRVRELNWGIYK